MGTHPSTMWALAIKLKKQVKQSISLVPVTTTLKQVLTLSFNLSAVQRL